MGFFGLTRQGKQGWNYQMDNYYDKDGYTDRDQGNWKKKDSYKYDRIRLYVPLKSRVKGGNDSGKMHMKEIMVKVLESMDSIYSKVKEIKSELSSVS